MSGAVVSIASGAEDAPLAGAPLGSEVPGAFGSAAAAREPLLPLPGVTVDASGRVCGRGLSGIADCWAVCWANGCACGPSGSACAYARPDRQPPSNAAVANNPAAIPDFKPCSLVAAARARRSRYRSGYRRWTRGTPASLSPALPHTSSPASSYASEPVPSRPKRGLLRPTSVCVCCLSQAS